MNLDSHQEEKLRRGLGLIVTETPPGKEWDDLTASKAAPAVGRRLQGVWIGVAAVLAVLVLFSPMLFLSGSGPAAAPGGTSAPPADITESTETAGEPVPSFPFLTLDLPDTAPFEAFDITDEETGDRVGAHTVYHQRTDRSDQGFGREILLRVQEVGRQFARFDELVDLSEGTETVEVGGRTVTVYLVPDEAIEEGNYDLAVLHWIESSGFEAILIPWGLDRDPALELMAGLRRVDSGTWTELTVQYQNPTTTTIVEAAETTPSTTPKPDAVTEPPAVVSISEVDTEPGYSRFDAEGHVDEVLGSTGIAYDEFPGFVPDAAVDNGRVVIVGGNAERIAGIWYSDDGTWTTAEIDFPDGVTIGESDGDMRLADGIQNVETDGRVFVAWEPVQVVRGQEPTSAGTIVFTSSDGTNWSANGTATEVAGLIPWNGGYIATYRDRSNDPAAWILGWSLDLTNWVELVDLGQDVPYAVERSGHGVLVRQEAGADASVDGIIRTTEVAFEGGD